MSNAALYIHPDAYDTTGARLMGRHSAGESFLRGYLRHAEVDRFHLWNVKKQPQADIEALLRRHDAPDTPRDWHADRGRLGEVGVLNLPIPGIANEAWARRPLGEQAYAICGVTHTTASDTIMRNVSDLLLSPLHDYDALICTSSVVRASVEAELDGVRAYLAQEYGPRRRPEPLRTVIPLGVNVADFAVSAAQRKAWRERLDIPEDAVVVLYVGRFEPRGKMNPALMAMALEQAAGRTTRPLYWLNSGWAETETSAADYHANSRALCPSVHYRHVDGRPADVRFSIWSAADLFISFSDNIQETFGLTPVEAMAAGLPCVVTDWNGYRDTVRHGEDGFRIPTYAPPPGAGGDFAHFYADTAINYQAYVGGAAQYTAIDLAAAAQAIVDLAENPDLRARLGAQAKARAQTVFDWAAIIPQYQALWAEQDARRRAAPVVATDPGNPFRPDPFTLFASYPTRHFRGDWIVSAPPGVAWSDVEALLTSPLAAHSGINRPALVDCAKLFEHVATRGPTTAAEAVAQFSAGLRPFVQRAILWMARFGAFTLTPSDRVG
ncbi:glycosyltransferase family 4 protein [Phenylobacterium sp. LjRoot219]|uniref:glycosyltransferase family 4 protein n=1 Tax=Phenylobacterium sp. LjRoot219 TaxID=3342283 RepID=UPI003ECC7061